MSFGECSSERVRLSSSSGKDFSRVGELLMSLRISASKASARSNAAQ